MLFNKGVVVVPVWLKSSTIMRKIEWNLIYDATIIYINLCIEFLNSNLNFKETLDMCSSSSFRPWVWDLDRRTDSWN